MARANLGTGLRLRNRACAPMAEIDGLPLVLRRWLTGAALPWSPHSALRIWRLAKAGGASDAEAIARCRAAEARMLDRESRWVQVKNGVARQ